MTETAKALNMQVRCAFSRLVLINTNPKVSRIVAVLFSSALTVGSDSAKDMWLKQPKIQNEWKQQSRQIKNRRKKQLAGSCIAFLRFQKIYSGTQ